MPPPVSPAYSGGSGRRMRTCPALSRQTRLLAGRKFDLKSCLLRSGRVRDEVRVPPNYGITDVGHDAGWLESDVAHFDEQRPAFGQAEPSPAARAITTACTTRARARPVDR